MNALKKGILAAALFAAVSVMPAWAIWEGNAGIAGSSEFPGTGNFAKSDMFPRNTIVEILNLETNIKIRAVITGSSGIPGLVAMLSPEAAAALHVRTGSVSRVRISVPSPVAESPADGTIAGGSGTRSPDPDANPETASLEAERLAALTAPPADPLVPAAAAVVEPVSAAVVEPAAVAVASAAAAPVTADPVPETPSPDISAETTIFAEPESPEIAESTEAAASEPEAIAESVSEPVPEAIESENQAPEIVAATGDFAEPQIPEPAETAPAAAELAPEAPGESLSPELFDEPELVVSEATEPTIDIGAVASESVPEPAASGETVVTLEPAEMMPPPAAATVAASPVIAPDAPPAPAAAKTAPVLAEPELALKEPGTTTSPIAVVPAVPQAGSANLPFITAFEKGKYYVQIASYAETANVRRVLDTWGAKYPIAIEQAAAKGNPLYKVYVGPVSRDEYGAVLERFKAAGYRDSFVKKGS